jgi:hypothetical protein
VQELGKGGLQSVGNIDRLIRKILNEATVSILAIAARDISRRARARLGSPWRAEGQRLDLLAELVLGQAEAPLYFSLKATCEDRKCVLSSKLSSR